MNSFQKSKINDAYITLRIYALKRPAWLPTDSHSYLKIEILRLRSSEVKKSIRMVVVLCSLYSVS